MLELLAMAEICVCVTQGKVHSVGSNYITQHVQRDKMSTKTAFFGNIEKECVTHLVIYVQNQLNMRLAYISMLFV